MVERTRTAPLATFFTTEEALEPRAQVLLGESVARHLRARRLGAGTTIALIDGAGRRASAMVVREAKDAVTVEIGDVEELPSPPEVHLMVPVADRDRMLWLAEKGAEVGVTSWRPVMWRRSRSVQPRGEGPVFSAKVRARMIAALEQSGGAHLPQIYPDAPLSRAISAVPAEGTRLLLDPEAPPVFGIPVKAPITLALGPEGGLENGEKAELRDAGFIPVSLGPGILRFETAGAVGAAIARGLLYHQDEAAHVR
jgi:16S rRNA (uracil1498-N3)-methyltransferase